MQLIFILEQVVNGLVLGGYYLLIALGLSLIFSVGGVVNLSHGAFYALGAYVSVEISRVLGFVPAIVLSPVAVGLIGVLFDRFILRRFYTADPRSEEHTSELQSLMRISYAVFCLKKKIYELYDTQNCNNIKKTTKE